MLSTTIVLVLFPAGLAVLLGPVRRRLPGSAGTRQLALSGLVLLLVAGFGAWAVPRHGPEAPDRWEPGELRADGLRIVPSGRSDAADVLDPASFAHPLSRELYGIAAEIPGILNRLHCWCGCVRHGRHRSALACFEDASAVGCGICQETARIAWREVQRGVTDPPRIQRTVDREWAPAGAWREQLRRSDGADHGRTP